jgi:streptomycin 6-kinase
MLKWVAAYAGLSASWHLKDDSNPNLSLSIAEIAINLLKYKSYR